MSTEYHDDLLQPTLSAEDDAIDFREPWNPWSLVTLSFFFGLIAGGSLLAFNFERLGIKDRLVPTLAVVAVLTLVMAGSVEWAFARGIVASGDDNAKRTVRWTVQGLSCLIAIGLSRSQRRRFRLFQTSGRPSGSLWKPGILAVAAALVLELFVHLAFIALFRGRPL